jgi:O-antigen ligase
MLIVFSALLFSVLIEPLMAGEHREASALTAGANLQGVGGDPVNQIFWLTLFGLTAAAAWVARHQLLPIPRHLCLLAAFLVFAVCSTAWSQIPPITLRRAALQAVVTIAMVTPFLIHPRPRELLTAASLALGAAIFASLAWHYLQGPRGADGATGVYGHKNTLGQIAAVSSILLAGEAYSARRMWIKMVFAGCAICGVYLCVISGSKTSQGLLLFTPLAASFFVALGRMELAAKRVIIAGISFVASLLSFAALASRFGLSDMSRVLFGDPTFTGRTVIWHWMWKYIANAPLLGHGYGSFWAAGPDSKPVREGYWYIQIINDGHNGYIDVLIGTGAIGLTIAVLFCLFLLPAVASIHDQHRCARVMLLAVLLFILLHNAMETSLFSGYRPLWLLLLLVAGFSARGHALRSKDGI